MNKSGQLQIQETIMVVFIFVIIIIIGMSVFFKFQENSIKQELRSFKIEQLSNNILTMADTSEFVYTKNGIKQDSIDTSKLMALKSLIKRNNKYYFNNYGYMNITIYEVYPIIKNKECKEVLDLNDCGVWKIYEKIPIELESRLIKKTPVSIYNLRTRDYSVGMMIIEVYNA